MMLRLLLPLATCLPAIALGGPISGGVVQDPISHAPIAGAHVQIIGTQRVATTDAEGRFTLEAPDGFRWLHVSAPGRVGAKAPVGHGEPIALWPEQIGDVAVRRVFQARARQPLQDDPNDPALRPEARALILAGPRDAPRLKQQADLPQIIRVWRRPEGVGSDRSCDGPVEELSVDEYTRGVVPHEWIPSWDVESLKAGAMAARTYAAWWAHRGGKYDCADLDDTTRSQVYSDGRNDRGDEAVAATAGEFILDGDGALVFAEYSAENSDPTEYGVEEPLCTGRDVFGHGRGMCQWGTQRWATQRGQTYDWMVSHYYPGASVGGGATPFPDLHLAQGIERLDPLPCADPANTYQCADFVPQGWSRGVLDLFVGQQARWQITITNQGGAELPAGAQIYLEMPRELQAIGALLDGEPITPPDAGDLGVITLPALSPGRSSMISLSLRVEESSLDRGAPTGIRTWVRSVDGLYEKITWGDPPQENQGQTFNGGDLRALFEFDLYERNRWRWDHADGEMAEGWYGPGGQLQIADGALQFTGEALSPFTAFDAETSSTVRHAGDIVRLWWRGAGESFQEDRSIMLDAEEIDLSTVPTWAGQIEQVRLTTGGAAQVDLLWFDVPGAPPPPDAHVPDPVEDAGVSPRPDATPLEPMGGAMGGAGGAGGFGGEPAPAGGVIDPGPGLDTTSPNRVSHSGGCASAPMSAPGGLLLWLMLLGGLWIRRSR